MINDKEGEDLSHNAYMSKSDKIILATSWDYYDEL